MARISIRMDDALKMDGEAVLERVGLNMSSAVTVFMKQVVRYGGLPFQVTVADEPADKRLVAQRAIENLSRLAANNQVIDKDYKFNREACYDE